jgi:hypothetical protein
MYRVCFPHLTVFLYFWHIHRAWLKYSFKKIVDHMVHLHIFIEIGDVMYLKGVGVHLGTCLTQVEAKRKALNKLS